MNGQEAFAVAAHGSRSIAASVLVGVLAGCSGGGDGDGGYGGGGGDGGYGGGAQAPTVSLSIAPTTIGLGQSATLTWS